VATCVILQPSYIPWRGFFDLAHRSDVFVFYDDVQYDKHGWRNRNRVKTSQGTQWLTIPVLSSGNVEEGLLVKDARIASRNFTKKHLATLRQCYAKAPFFTETWSKVEPLFTARTDFLCDLTIPSAVALARLLGIERTRFVRSSELGVGGGKTERLVNIVRHLGCDRYLSGPAARDYLDVEQFRQASIELEYIVYDYPEYPQLYPPYDPQVTVLDLLFMQGSRAGQWIWGPREALLR
jgi:hypothetical protein